MTTPMTVSKLVREHNGKLLEGGVFDGLWYDHRAVVDSPENADDLLEALDEEFGLNQGDTEIIDGQSTVFFNLREV